MSDPLMRRDEKKEPTAEANALARKVLNEVTIFDPPKRPRFLVFRPRGIAPGATEICDTFETLEAANGVVSKLEGAALYHLLDGEPVDPKEPTTFPLGATPTRCRYCGRPVLWIETTKSAKLCVDITAPVYIVAIAGVRGELVGVNVNRDGFRPRLTPLFSKPIVGTFVSHFCTCSKVDQVKRDQLAKKKKGGDGG